LIVPARISSFRRAGQVHPAGRQPGPDHSITINTHQGPLTVRAGDHVIVVIDGALVLRETSLCSTRWATCRLLSPSGGQRLFHLVSKLYERTSVIITINLAFAHRSEQQTAIYGRPY
jgi:hypothetical protein